MIIEEHTTDCYIGSWKPEHLRHIGEIVETPATPAVAAGTTPVPA